MTIDFSVFINRDTIIFFAVSSAILVVVVVACLFIIRAIFRFLKSLFQKKFEEHAMGGVLDDKGEDLTVNIEELEKSKEERAKIQRQKQSAPTIKYNQSAPSKEPKKEVRANKEQEWSQKNQEDIEAGLNKLKGSDEVEFFLEEQAETKDDDISISKIKISVAKRPATGGGIGAPVQQGNLESKDQSDQNKKEQEDFSTLSHVDKDHVPTPGKTSAIQENRMEGLKDSGVKISKGKLPKNLEEFIKSPAYKDGPAVTIQEKEKGSFFEKPEFIKENSKTNQKDKVKVLGQKDTSIFEGKGEISRANLREKLRKDLSVLKIGREMGLNMSPVERAKLEKQVFSQSFGGNISKTDLRWGIKKLNDKLLSAKSPTEHAKIRKEIKFFKKIGGIKQ